MAGLWQLPVVYLIENNRYGMGTAVERAAAITDIAERALAYDIPHAVVDGQDVLAVRRVVGEAVARARELRVPTLVESRTYRFMGHSMSDAVSGTYRTKAELDENLKRDPIALLRAHMHERGQLTDEEVAQLDAEVSAVVEDAWQFADQAPEPAPDALLQDVLVADGGAGAPATNGASAPPGSPGSPGQS